MTALTSLQSSVEALHRADQMLSPASNVTGATGSTESSRRATKSLLESIAGRSESEFSNFETRRESIAGGKSDFTAKLPREKSLGGESRCGNGSSDGTNQELELEPKFVATPPSRKASHNSSWSVISDQPIRIKTEEDLEVHQAEDDLMSITSVTPSQEEEGLTRSVTRSQSDFSKWLEDTMKMARGDGTSIVDSEEAFIAISEVTREIRTGARSSYAGSEGGGSGRLAGLGSPFQYHHRGGVQSPLTTPNWELLSAESEEEVMGEAHLEDEEVIVDLGNDSVVIKQGDVETEVPEIKVEQDTNAEQKGVETSTQTQSTKAGINRWKLLSVMLGLGLAHSILTPHYPSLLSTLSLLVAALRAQFRTQPHPEEQIALLHPNITLVENTFTIPISVGLAIPYQTIAVTLFALVSMHFGKQLHDYVTGTHCHPKAKTPARSTSPSPKPMKRQRFASPLLELDATSVFLARDLITEGIKYYLERNLYQAGLKFEEASKSTGASPVDKAIASEWLGRTLYRQARPMVGAESEARRMMELAARAFERSVRLDSTKPTARASWGRSLFRLERFEEAIKPLQMAVKRDPTLAFAHEWLGKTLAKLDDHKGAEVHLREALKLDPTSYSTSGFLGELLHMEGRTEEAKTFLLSAVSHRSDLPAFHALLAFIATEQVDTTLAAHHLRLVISTRETGHYDRTVHSPALIDQINGSAPFLRLYFTIPATSRTERIEVLRQASRTYPQELILSVLLCIKLRRSLSRLERTSGITELKTLETCLEKRVLRYTLSEDLEARGLLALCLVGLGRQKRAESVYEEFWIGLAGKGGLGKVKEMAWFVMAFYELKKTR